VIKQGEAVLAEWPVESQAEGQQQLMDLVHDAMEDDDDDKDDD
jgi:hypothetical protein